MKKRISALVLTTILLVGTAIPALAAGTVFSDVPSGFWAGEAIRTMAERNIVSGYENGSFRPGQKVTNAQFAVMLARAFYPTEAKAYAEEGYGDSAPWYWSSMAALRDHGVLNGTAMGGDGGWPVLQCDGDFVTRYDMAQLAYNVMLDYEQSGSGIERELVPSRVRDWDVIPEAYQDAVTACYVLGVLEGQADGSFDGTSLMSRAQSCVVIERLGKGLGVNIGTGKPGTGQSAEKVLVSGEPVTEENVKNLLQRVATEWQGNIRASVYLAGNSSMEVREIIWSYRDINGRTLSMTSGAAGYVARLSDRVFGRYGFPARKLDSLSQMRAGDIVITLQDGRIIHAATYSGESGMMMTVEGRLAQGYGAFSVKDSTAPGTVVVMPEDVLPGRTYEVWTRYPE